MAFSAGTGVQLQGRGRDQARRWLEHVRMLMWTVAFLVVRRVLGLVGLGPSPDAKDVEIAVLRHQLMVLHRQIARPRYTPSDRLILATLASLLPRATRYSANCRRSSSGWSARAQPAKPVSPRKKPASPFDHDKALLATVS
jgi:hypothetical protein